MVHLFLSLSLKKRSETSLHYNDSFIILLLFVKVYGHEGAVTCLQFDDSRIISSALDRLIKIWDFTGHVRGFGRH